MKQILIGIVIGIANIIPGVSGGTMAVSMGIYDKLIHSVTHVTKEFKKSVMYILPILVGAALAIVGLSFAIEYFFENFPVQTNFLFIGLMLGGLPVVIQRLKGTGKKVSTGNIIALIAFFILVVGFAALGDGGGESADVTFNLVNVVKLFGVGIVASATMIIPGVSGSMMLMLMGYYHVILETITLFIKSVLAFDMQGILTAMGVLVPAGIGILLGIVVIAKIIEIVFEKLPNYAFSAIIGLIIASPVAIIMMSDLTRYTWSAILVGLVTFVIGYFIATKLGEK